MFLRLNRCRQLCFDMYWCRSVLLVLRVTLMLQVWLQRGKRCTSVTSGRPGRKSSRLKRTKSSPPFLRISKEGSRWGQSFLPSCMSNVCFTDLRWMNCVINVVLPAVLSHQKGNSFWNNIECPDSVVFPWDHKSTYIRSPSFFSKLVGPLKALILVSLNLLIPNIELCVSWYVLSQSKEVPPPQSIESAHVLLFLGNKVTTDHISPAGSIARVSAAAKYLLSKRSVSDPTPEQDWQKSITTCSIGSADRKKTVISLTYEKSRIDKILYCDGRGDEHYFNYF